MKQFLKPTEGTQKAANHPAQQNADEQQKAHYIVGKVEFGGANDRLNRTDGAGSRSGRTGIAVQPGDTDPFQFPTRDFALKEVQKERIGGQRRSQLDLPAMSVLSQCPHTPCKD